MNSGRSRISIRTLAEITTIEDFLFYCAFAIFSFAEVLKSTAFVLVITALAPLCTALLYCSAAMLVLRFMLLKASHFQWIAVLAICGLAGILYKQYGLQYPLWIFLFVVAGARSPSVVQQGAGSRMHAARGFCAGVQTGAAPW